MGEKVKRVGADRAREEIKRRRAEGKGKKVKRGRGIKKKGLVYG